MMKASLLPTTLLLTSLLIITVTILTISLPTEAFQTPIIFPLLWLSKQLKTPNNRHNHQVAVLSAPSRHARGRQRLSRSSRPPPTLLPSLSITPFFSALANIVATKITQSDQKLLSWITQESSSSDSTATAAAIRNNIRIDNHPKTQLRGLFSQRDFRSNELIVEVPYHVALLVGDTLTLRQDYYPNNNNLNDLDQNNNEIDDDGSCSWDEGDVEDVLQGLYFLENFVKGASFQQYDDTDRYDTKNGDQRDEYYDDSEEYDYELDCDYYAPYVTSLPSKPIGSNNDSNSDNHNHCSYDNEEGLTPDFWSDSTINEIGIPTYSQQILDRKRIVQTIAQNNNVNESDLQWATFMIRSRRFTTWNMVPDPMYMEEEEQQQKKGGG